MSRAVFLTCALCAATPSVAAPAQTSLEVDEHLGARVPETLAFVDDAGRSVRLGDYLHGAQPILLVLAYFRCTMLCDLVLHGVVASVERQGLELGPDFRAITISIDPHDSPATAAHKQSTLLRAVDRPEARDAWPFLVGQRPAIDLLAASVGFPYVHDETTDQYAHPAVALVLTPDGRVSRYLYGVTFRPLDVRLALDEAAAGRIGNVVDRVLLTCFRYDPASRRYGPYVRGFFRIGASCVLFLLGGLLLYLSFDRSRGRR